MMDLEKCVFFVSAGCQRDVSRVSAQADILGVSASVCQMSASVRQISLAEFKSPPDRRGSNKNSAGQKTSAG